MSYSTKRAQYESCLARAHRQLYYARLCAEEMNDVYAAQQLGLGLEMVTTLNEDSLRGRARAIKGQMRLPGVPG